MDLERKVKRLRGWQKDMEVQKTNSSPCQKEKEPEGSSALCSKLLQLWAQGLLSAKLMAELAHLAVLDGCAKDDLFHLARLGSFGSSLAFQSGFPVTVMANDPKTRHQTHAEASIHVPHLMFSALGTHYPEEFGQMFGTAGLQAFWEGVAAKKGPRLSHHFGKRWDLDKRHTIPLFIHGDGVEFQTRDSLMCWSFGGLLCPLSSLNCHLLLAAWPKTATHQETWAPMDELLAWSFEALLKGKLLLKLPNGAPLPKGSFMAKVAGQQLVPGSNFRGIIWSIQGDHEFFCNTLHMPHWSTRSPCWQCDARRPTKKHPCPKGKNVKTINPAEQNFTPCQKESTHALFKVPGLTSQHLSHDALHVLYAKAMGAISWAPCSMCCVL